MPRRGDAALEDDAHRGSVTASSISETTANVIIEVMMGKIDVSRNISVQTALNSSAPAFLEILRRIKLFCLFVLSAVISESF